MFPLLIQSSKYIACCFLDCGVKWRWNGKVCNWISFERFLAEPCFCLCLLSWSLACTGDQYGVDVPSCQDYDVLVRQWVLRWCQVCSKCEMTLKASNVLIEICIRFPKMKCPWLMRLLYFFYCKHSSELAREVWIMLLTISFRKVSFFRPARVKKSYLGYLVPYWRGKPPKNSLFWDSA